MKKTLITLVAVAACGAAVGAGLGPQSYVQEGLVMHFDGIDNAGTGTHDPSATKWVDLKGSARISTKTGVTFGARWLDFNFADAAVDSMPSGLSNNPVTYDFSVNLISNYTTSASTTWPSILYNGNAYVHSTGFKNGDGVVRGFRFFVDSTEPRPYIYNVYTNTLCCISDATNIRTFKDGLYADTPCTSKVSRALTSLTLSHACFKCQFYTLRVYNRGLADDEVVQNSVVDHLRYFAPRCEGAGGTVDWSAAAWTDPDALAVSVPGAATNGYAVVKNAALGVADGEVGLLGLSLEDGASLDLADSAIASVRFLFVEGARIRNGIYTGTGEIGEKVPWLAGNGVVRVADSMSSLFPEEMAVPAADGWYEIGNPAAPVYNQGTGYSGSPSSGYQYFNGDKWTTNEFQRMAFPAGAKLRLVGGLICDTIPTSRFAEIDTTNKLKYIVFRMNRIFDDGRVFVVPEGCSARYQPGTWKFDGGKHWLTGADAEQKIQGSTFYSDLEVNGTLVTSLDNTHLSDATFSGRITGKGNGTLLTSSFWNYQRFTNDEFAFRGYLKAGSSGTGFLFAPKSVTGSFTNFYCNSCLGNYQYNTSYCASGLLFGPQKGNPTCDGELFFYGLDCNASINTDTNGKTWRNGGEVVVWGSNTVHAANVNSSAHVIGSRVDQNCASGAFKDAVCFGTGNFVGDTLKANIKLFLGTNVYVTVGTARSGCVFDYTYHSGAVNRMTLDITSSCDASATVKATDLAMLPARLSGFKGTVTLNDVAMAPTCPMTVDFDKELYTTDGCIGSGTLSAAPASGTVNVTLAGTPKKGEYSLFRFDRAVGAGGQPLFANWAVNVVGHEGESQFTVGSGENMKIVTVKKDATGLWLKVSNPGLQVILR